MTKEVLISIKGLQMLAEGEEDEEALEMVTAGDYYMKNGSHFVKYDEVIEGFSDVTKNYIRIKPHSVEVRKRGIVNVHMVFEENKKNVTYYTTPYGQMQMGLAATRVNIKETDENIDVAVDYALEINEQHVADCSIFLNVKSKDARDFSLEM